MTVPAGGRGWLSCNGCRVTTGVAVAESGGELIRQLWDWGARLFPELQILLRRRGRVVYISLSGARQAAAVSALLVFVLCLGYLGLRVQHFGTRVLSRNHALVQADQQDTSLTQQLAATRDALAEAESRAEAVGEQNDKLSALIADSRKQLAALQAEHERDVAELQQRTAANRARQDAALATAQQQIATLDGERKDLTADRGSIERKLEQAQQTLSAKSSSVAALSKELAKDRDLLRHSDSNQVALQTRIQMLEKELAQANLATGQFKAQLANIESRLGGLAAERDRLLAQRDTLRNAQRQGGLVGKALDNRATAAALAKIGNAESARVNSSDVATAIPAVAGHRIERLLASTGLNLKKLLHDISISEPQAEGGPFIPLGDAMTAGEEARRHKLLQKLVETLPLRAPLDHYYVSSPFGPRLDPFNHRRAFHEGVDLAAPYRTHVYSTAPGIVVFAGADSGFGKLVKIDDGHGIVTMFAHMHRIFVVRGQHVPAHFPVGELGCTGRCTGPHVHYQIEVDGTPVNPAKFLGAGGNVVQVGAKQ
jgi:murein DD-endopeptidase MepM/ murein hydrolase activator NlpD